MKRNNFEKVLQFEQDDSIIKLKPKYNKPKETKDNSIHIGITNYLSKLHKQRTQKVQQNIRNLKNHNIFNIMYHDANNETSQQTEIKIDEKTVKNTENANKTIEKNNDSNDEDNKNKKTISSKPTEEIKKTILPPINLNKIKHQDKETNITIDNKHIDANLPLDITANPSIAYPKKKNSPVNINKIKKNPNFSMDNITLYSLLSKQTREYYGGMKNKYNLNKSVRKDKSNNNRKLNKLKVKEALMKKIEVTHFLDHKDKNDIPFILPVATTYKRDFQNFSQKKRYEKIKQKLLELRLFLEGDEENEIKIVKEFFLKNGIIDETAYDIDRVNNFIRFIKSDLSNLSINLSLQQVIELASFNYFEKKAENKKNKKKNGNFDNSKQKLEEKINDIYSVYSSKLDNFEKSLKINKNDEKDIISKLSNELNNTKYQIDVNQTKGVTRSKSQNNSQIFHNITKENKFNTEFDLFLNKNDVEKIKKNNKLLELIVLQRAKNKILLKEHAMNENIPLEDLKY